MRQIRLRMVRFSTLRLAIVIDPANDVDGSPLGKLNCNSVGRHGVSPRKT